MGEPATRRFAWGLVTRATCRFEWGQFAGRGRVHRIVSVIIRWDFLGGTFEHPNVTFVAACGPQVEVLRGLGVHSKGDECLRCAAVARKGMP